MLLFSHQKNAFTNLSNLLLKHYHLKFWHSISGMDCKLETELCHYATFKKCFFGSLGPFNFNQYSICRCYEEQLKYISNTG